MAFEDKKKISRKPLSQKEVANLVAIKNGMHDQKGFISTNSSINFENNINIKDICKKIEQYYDK